MITVLYLNVMFVLSILHCLQIFILFLLPSTDATLDSRATVDNFSTSLYCKKNFVDDMFLIVKLSYKSL